MFVASSKANIEEALIGVGREEKGGELLEDKKGVSGCEGTWDMRGPWAEGGMGRRRRCTTAPLEEGRDSESDRAGIWIVASKPKSSRKIMDKKEERGLGGGRRRRRA